MKNLLFYYPAIFVLALAAIILATSKASAYDVPSFPSCTNPDGLTITSSYPDGVHGIIGDYSVHTGSDTVYQVSDTTVMQCFCDQNHNGIQTNWWKVSDLSQDEISALENEGWTLASNGADWGLDQGPYLAKNTTYDCSACVTPTPTATPSAEVTPTPEATPSATPTLSPSLTPTPEAGSSGTVQAVSESSAAPAPVAVTSQPQVLAATTLAYTGNASEIIISFFAGLVSIASGMALKKRAI